MPDGGEPGHVRADLGEDHIGAGQADAGDLIEPGYRVGERGGPRPIRGWARAEASSPPFPTSM